MRKLLVLTQHFPPSSEIAGKVTARLLRHLGAHGWEPTVLTVPPEQAGAPLDPRGYADVLEQIEVERVGRWPYGIDLLRLASQARKKLRGPTGATHPAAAPLAVTAPEEKRFRRLTRMLGFPDPRAGWVAPAALHARRMLARGHFDAVLTVAPPQSTNLAGLALHRLAPRVPWIAQLHDPWADLDDVLEPDRMIRRAMLAFESVCVHAATEVWFATDEVLDGYAARYPDLPRAKLGVLPNGYDPADFPAHAPAARTPGAPLHIVHLGTIYAGRDPSPFLRGIAALVASGAVAASDLRIDFIGDLDTRRASIEQVVREGGLGGAVNLLGLVPHAEAIRRMMEADVLLLLAQGQRHQIPAKLYEYVNAGKFVLAFTDGASARVMHETGAGRVVGPDDDVAAALRDVLDLHRAGRLARWEVPEAKLRPYQVSHLAGWTAARLDRVVGAA